MDETRDFGKPGSQLVECNGYAYRWSGPDSLKVGDAVMLPANAFSVAAFGPGPWRSKVTKLGSAHLGWHADILRRTV